MIKNVGLWRVRIFLILTTMTLFIACQKDDESSPPQLEINQNLNSQIQTITTNVNLDEIPQVADYLSTIGNGRMKFTITKLYDGSIRLNEPDLTIGELQTKEILQVTDQYDRKNYTFLLTSIEGNDSSITSVFNLIVKESYKVGLFSYIIEYRPHPDWIPNDKDTQDLSNYTGDILHYSIEGEFKAKSTILNGISVNFQTKNCDDPDNDGGNSGGNSNDSNDGDSSDGNDGDSSDSNDGDSSDGNDGDSSSDDPPPCFDITIGADCSCGCDTCGDPVVVIICPELNQKIVGNDSFDEFLRTACGDVPDICYTIEGDPCDCNPDGITCIDTPPEDEPDNNDGDSNPTTGVIFDLELISDCRLLENIANSPSFQQRMQELIANNSGNTEIAYYGRNDNNEDMNYADDDRFESNEGEQEIVTSTPEDPIDSYIHNHFNNGHGTSSIFSPGDLFTLYKLYSQGRITNANDFVMIVTSPSISNSPDDDTVYAITISSENNFAEASSLLLSNLYFAENMFNKAGLKANVDPVIAERQMTQIIKDNEMGLNLFRGDINNLTDWTRVRRKNNNDFIERNCN